MDHMSYLFFASYAPNDTKYLFIIQLNFLPDTFINLSIKCKQTKNFSSYLRHAHGILKSDIPCFDHVRAAPVNYNLATNLSDTRFDK